MTDEPEDEVIESQENWRSLSQFTKSDWERFIEPNWPFTYEGFRHKYRCSICRKIINE